ncbi:double-strand break repair helicase AddA [Aliihoeflea aestuarii]|uniref:double-strand break repair helicase AddA n=1 Tax=Aliihoeflea aestuarii TaxID=453840 RepID=UPI002093B91B|nr:double-strand break repair helicase AddA [Aliihoeflea aestuarii]MCO6390987.1 double-strand break repair helicase AddA [Aliihoeflea aestuarii]
MRPAFVIPESTRLDQARASDPKNSAWVSANAGSGKTHVLSQRVIRLLLDGTDPSRILCLTYTRAAAANMSNRVFQTLSAWTALDDDALRVTIAGLDGRPPSPARMTRARRLFAEALETPGGLKIQTIHAFCEAILHQFPLEANVAGHFELLDGQMEAALIAEARRSMIAGAADNADPELAAAFADILDIAGESGLEHLLSEIVRQRDDLGAFVSEVGMPPENFAPFFAAFGFTGAETMDEILGGVWPDAYFDRDLSERFADRAAAAGKVRASQFAEDLTFVCTAHDADERFAVLRKTFLTKKGPVYEARSTKQILAKGVAEHFPEFEAEFARMADAVRTALDRAALFAMLRASRSALTLAEWLIARYERLKSARGFLDFNDLIRRTAALLARKDAGAWVHYKLDKGIDHILLDEAQDTSPDQWRVVRQLADEFFAGETAHEGLRTVFAVGDEKQSIYSFQGAEPEAFAVSGREFGRRVESAQKTFERVRLSHSFRSTQDVLSAVDLVFAEPSSREGLTRDIEDIRHSAIRTDAPGQVEIWPSLTPQEVEAPDDWTLAIDHTSAPAARLARNIAVTLKSWLDSGETIPGHGRLLTPGDVMVLVRKRGSFVHALSRELKNRHVPVAGADRLVLADHIAVKDLMAIGRFALQPEDDLSVAALLRSPIFGLSEERLFEIAHGRGRASLYAVLRGEAESDVEFRLIRDQLNVWRDEVGFMPAFEFYGRILGRDGARARIVARLGPEAGDVVDEFLNFCLAAQKSGAAGLEAVLAMLDGDGPEIKREMDQSRGEVRIMTTHAAKGLEAPVVFLVDSGSAPFSDSHLPILMPFDAPKREWAGRGFLWRAGSDTNNDFARAIAAIARTKAEQEYRRLLYVGMTRAEDRLIVCGYQGKRAPTDMTWHAMVARALEASPATARQTHAPTGDDILVYRVTPRATAPVIVTPDAARDEPVPLPAALSHRLAAPPPVPRPLAPSGVRLVIEPGAETAVSGSPVLDAVAGTSHALERGTAIHRLLQSLPDVEPQDREASAHRYLGRLGAGWSEVDRAQAWSRIGAILGDPEFADLFSANSRAEVSIMGRVRIGSADRAISGKIDRLVVTDDSVLIVDYKTNRPPPATLAQVPPSHVAQMALYRALLQPLYPGRPVRAALLFTEAPVLIEVPEDAMEASLARLGEAVS